MIRMQGNNYAPKFRKIETELREKIETRVWQPGQQIPTEAELCSSFNVSKTTIRSAIAELVLQGLLERIQGKGTFVSTDSKVKTITLVGWGPSEKPFDTIWQDIRTAFKSKFTNLDLNIIPVPYTKLRNWLIEHVSHGRAPDIAQIDSAWDMELASLGMTQPLGNLISAEAQDDLLPALRRLSTYRGELYSWPEAPMPFYLYCNKRLRERAGFFSPPETIDELEQQARAIADLNNGDEDERIWGLTIDTYPWVWSANSFLPILYNFGGVEMDDSGVVLIESDEAEIALEWCLSLVEDDVLGPLGTSVAQARKIFGQGRTGFYLDHPGGRAQAARFYTGRESFDDTIEVVLFPRQSTEHHESIAALWNFVLFRQSPNLKEAALFLEWVTRDPSIVGRYFEVTGGLPPNRLALLEEKYQDRFSIPALEQLKTSRRPFEARPDKQVELSNALSFIVRDVLIHGKAVRQALSEGSRVMKVITGEIEKKDVMENGVKMNAIWQSN